MRPAKTRARGICMKKQVKFWTAGRRRVWIAVRTTTCPSEGKKPIGAALEIQPFQTVGRMAQLTKISRYVGSVAIVALMVAEPLVLFSGVAREASWSRLVSQGQMSDCRHTRKKLQEGAPSCSGFIGVRKRKIAETGET